MAVEAKTLTFDFHFYKDDRVVREIISYLKFETTNICDIYQVNSKVINYEL